MPTRKLRAQLSLRPVLACLAIGIVASCTLLLYYGMKYTAMREWGGVPAIDALNIEHVSVYNQPRGSGSRSPRLCVVGLAQSTSAALELGKAWPLWSFWSVLDSVDSSASQGA